MDSRLSDTTTHTSHACPHRPLAKYPPSRARPASPILSLPPFPRVLSPRPCHAAAPAQPDDSAPHLRPGTREQHVAPARPPSSSLAVAGALPRVAQHQDGLRRVLDADRVQAAPERREALRTSHIRARGSTPTRPRHTQPAHLPPAPFTLLGTEPRRRGRGQKVTRDCTQVWRAVPMPSTAPGRRAAPALPPPAKAATWRKAAVSNVALLGSPA